ncbi:MAG: hypothetical protein ACKOI2_00690 [Actinomycetota bacterium]
MNVTPGSKVTIGGMLMGGSPNVDGGDELTGGSAKVDGGAAVTPGGPLLAGAAVTGVDPGEVAGVEAAFGSTAVVFPWLVDESTAAADPSEGVEDLLQPIRAIVVSSTRARRKGCETRGKASMVGENTPLEAAPTRGSRLRLFAGLAQW